MSKLTEVEISFKERNLEKFKNQIRSIPKDSRLLLIELPTCREWSIFFIEMYKNYEENKEYIAVLRESPDETMRESIELLDKKDAGVRIVNQLVQHLMDVESQASGKCVPNETYTMNMPPLVITGQDRILLRMGGIAMILDIFNKL
ncbi:MAG: hypothetical protein AB2992_06185 [Candidatus Symbiodolus clandestinus]